MDTGYKHTEGLKVYESAMAVPYMAYARVALRKLLKKHGAATGSSLDLACGGGHLVQVLAGAGWTAYGCDLSADMIETALANYPPLRDRFFVADMRELPTDGSYDLITVVFNSIHYLDANGRRQLWRSLGASLKPGGLFLSQQNTLEAMNNYWLGRTHLWQSRDGFSLWTGTPGPAPQSISIEKHYFETIGGDSYRLSRARHDYHLFALDEMKAGLENQGIRIVGLHDGATLAPYAAESQATSIWVVAKKTKPSP